MSKNHRNNINYNRRPLNSDEDLTRKISHSIFVTNFPDSVTSRDLWKECSVYGTVVDVFIPAKKSTAGKRFAFVRFIKVFNLDRLVKNLCTLWIGSHHLFANQVRFDRPQKSVDYNHRFPPLKGSPKDFGRMDKFSEPDRRLGKSGPHLFVANGHSVFPGSSISPSPALVLGDECIVERDFSKCAMGRVKDINSIPNLRIILADEGFEEVKFFYLGGKWVLFEFDMVESKEKLINHTGVNSWFHAIQDVIQDFVSDERIIWMDIEGIPLCAWSRETFSRIGKKWGEILDIEDNFDSSFGRKRLCISTKHPTSILETFKIIVKGKVFMVRAKELFTWNPVFVSTKEKAYSSDDESVCGEKDKEVHSHLNEEEEGEFVSSDVDEVADTNFDNGTDLPKQHNEGAATHSEDPFGLYKLLNKKQPAMETRVPSPSLSHPPGFSPVGSAAVNQSVQELREVVNNTVEEASPLISTKVMHSSHHVQEDISGTSVGIGKDKHGGSVLGVLEEVIRVGRAMGYDMKGCEKDVEAIIGNQGDVSVFR
ncbi:RNA-directed DNA polymerase, eukaryota [Tanacetum coccineum]